MSEHLSDYERCGEVVDGEIVYLDTGHPSVPWTPVTRSDGTTDLVPPDIVQRAMHHLKTEASKNKDQP